jgi:hypothetical protein
VEAGNLVFILARPPTVAGRFGSSSRGVFEWCHWAVLVCDDTITFKNLEDLLAKLNGGRLSSEDFMPARLGFLFQLFRAVDSVTSLSSELDVTEPFTTEHLIGSFSNCSLAFVGRTTLETDDILATGSHLPCYLPSCRTANKRSPSRLSSLVQQLSKLGTLSCPQYHRTGDMPPHALRCGATVL